MASETPTREQVEALIQQLTRRVDEKAPDDPYNIPKPYTHSELVDYEVGWVPGPDAMLDTDVADALTALQARITALEAELRDEKYGKAIANVAAMGEVAAESVELVRQQDARIATLEADLALRNRLEAAGIVVVPSRGLVVVPSRGLWDVRTQGGEMYHSCHTTEPEARAAAVRLLEGDAT